MDAVGDDKLIHIGQIRTLEEQVKCEKGRRDLTSCPFMHTGA